MIRYYSALDRQRYGIPVGWRVVDYEPWTQDYVLARAWYAPPIRLWVMTREYAWWLVSFPHFVATWWRRRPQAVKGV